MDDPEVTRQAIGISLSSWSQLETEARKASSDRDILLAYVKLCPFVAASSPAIQAAVSSLQRAPTRRNAATMHPKAKEPTAEATRVAMRIAISAWSQLLVQSETLNDFDVMQKYIQQCPFVGSASEATRIALEGLQHGSTLSPPPLDDVETDSEESVVEKDKQRSFNTPIPSNSRDNGPVGSAIAPKRSKAIRRPLLSLFRAIVLDFPMAFLFAAYLGLMWVRRVDQLYIKPSMDAAVWDDDRAEQEITYYNRRCDARDMTTTNADDLLVPYNATIQEAYAHQLYHGFSLIQGVLTDDVMHDLRTYVDSRNRKLSAEESIFVIENANRFSFGLGTEVPCVARAVKQLATHSKLAPMLEMVLGPDPALIEMTAITSSYGAVDQYWHDDVIASASVMQYGRSFGPSYSIFIQLQNTTKSMGATETCPGSHKCATGKIEEYCDKEGFQAVDSRTGYWKAGDALLMNMNSYHRGTAHTDPNAPDRVMLILTFVPKPEERAESRQLSQGITFSLRWDMWGHTLRDLADADTLMTQPWATLRALGLYKPKDAAWGIDYVSSATMRMANGDNGFRDDELDVFLETGGFPFLPDFLQGQIKNGESWHEFLVDTVERCLEFLGYVNIFVVSSYGLFLMMLLVALPVDFGLRGVGSSLLRSGVVYSLVFMAWRAANSHVDNTDWARDIIAGRRYSVDFGTEEPISRTLKHLSSTFPHRKDVLVETRYGSRQFHMYNDFTATHPGSLFFRKLIRKYSFAYSQVDSDFFRDAAAAYVVGAVHANQGRFLFQGGNEWLWLAKDDAIDFTKAEFAVENSFVLRNVRREIRFLESDSKYGFVRSTALAQHSLNNLQNLKSRLLSTTPFGKAIFTSVNNLADDGVAGPQARASRFAEIREELAITSSDRPFLHHIGRRRIVGLSEVPKEPSSGAWLKSGDIVEGTEFLEDGDAHWYKGMLHKVTASGDFFIEYDDNSFGVVDSTLVRAYKPYHVGEEVEVFISDEGGVESCTIVTDNGNGTYDVFLGDDEQLMRQVPSGNLRRFRNEDIENEREVKNHYAA